MKKYILLATILLVNTNCFAGFPPFTSVSPSSVIVGSEIFIGYDPLQFPCLQSLANFQGDSQYINIDSNNHVEITISALGFTPCLNIGVDNPPYTFHSLGILPVGEYTVQMYWTDTSTPLPVPPNLNRLPLGDVLSFGVLSPVVIPLLNFYSLIFLGVLLMLISLFHFRRNAKIIISSLIILLLFSQNISAKTFHILLTADNGSPTPEDVVVQSLTSPSPPAWLLSSFNLSAPENVDYLILERPVGNLLNLVTNAPDWSLAKLYRYLVVRYPDSVDENAILANFNNDPSIIKAGYVDGMEITTSLSYPKLNKKSDINSTASIKGVGTNFLTDLNINSAWELSEGMGYVGALDLGFELEHPDLKAFDNQGNYQGTNILGGFYQIDYGDNDLNVDENEPFDTQGFASLEACDLQDGVDDNLATSIFIGHGTHITGILAGKNNNVGGICKNCGMSMMKGASYRLCINYNGVNTLFPLTSFDSAINSIRTLAQIGVGTINWSGGVPTVNENFCVNDGTGLCEAKDFILQQNVMIVASAGNHRTILQFPASEVGTVAVGGLAENGDYWNESPSNNNPLDFSDDTNCPRANGQECGSNFSHTPINQKLDVMTQARTVFSTFYEGGQWADDIGCTDFQDGSIDGYGNCTGTSMSAPQVAAIIQLMRSTIPLLPNGTYDPTKTDGLINILNATSSRSTSGLGLSDFFGYGLPDARLALERILGESNGVQMKNRLTPMFANVSIEANNNMYTPFPQVAVAFLLTNGAVYTPDSSKSLVNEFTEFWYDTVNLTFPAPRAEFYVFTTNNNPFSGTKNLVPLRRMNKTVTGDRNDTYAVSDAEIKTFHNDGYDLAGIEGYILPITQCNPNPCTGAIALYRDESDSLNHKLVPTNSAPPNSVLLGYVYLNQDTDGDGLIDGQEIILGTNILVQDTDGDTVPDGVEYPPAGVPYSDPRISDIIFKNGFE